MKSRLYTALAVAVGIAVGVGLTRVTDALRTAPPGAVAQAASTTRVSDRWRRHVYGTVVYRTAKGCV